MVGGIDMAGEGADEINIDIYDVLEACTTDELAPAVNALTKATVSFLKLTRAYEKHQPQHERYTDQIGDEIYRLGTLAVGLSDGKRPTYQTMVLALWKHIGFASGSGSLSSIEVFLINSFAKRHLWTVPPEDRAQLAADASNVAAHAASGIFTTEAWPPLASVLVQLAFLRQKLIGDGRLKPTIALIPAPMAIVPTGSGGSTEVVSVRLRGEELLLSPVADVPLEGWIAMDAVPNLSSALDPILTGIQPLIAAAQMLRTDELLRRLPDGAEGVAHIVETGRQGMGRLGTVPVASLMGPMAIMTLAGAMAEQRKLEAIEKSLAEIKTAIADVSRFQKEERRSVLKGAIRYFQQVGSAVLTGELASEVLQEIERHEVELVRIQEHLAVELRSQIAAMRAVKKETFGSSKYLKALREAQVGLDAKYDELLLCFRARACGYQLLCAYPGREAGKKARLADISDALDAFSPMGEATVEMDAVLREKIAASSYDAKSILLGSENALLDRIVAARMGIMEGLRGIRPDLEGISIDLRVKNGQPVAMRLA